MVERGSASLRFVTDDLMDQEGPLVVDVGRIVVSSGQSTYVVVYQRQGHVDFEGTFHAARDLEHRPVGPRPGRIPITMGAKGERMLQLAVRHADTWSCYVE